MWNPLKDFSKYRCIRAHKVVVVAVVVLVSWTWVGSCIFWVSRNPSVESKRSKSSRSDTKVKFPFGSLTACLQFDFSILFSVVVVAVDDVAAAAAGVLWLLLLEVATRGCIKCPWWEVSPTGYTTLALFPHRCWALVFKKMCPSWLSVIFNEEMVYNQSVVCVYVKMGRCCSCVDAEAFGSP